MLAKVFAVDPVRLLINRMVAVLVLLSLTSIASADMDHSKQLYKENCAPCHGESGKGDGVGARSLPVRPADHTNGAAMGARSDVFLRDVITKGGAPWGYRPSCRRGKGFLKTVKYSTW